MADERARVSASAIRRLARRPVAAPSRTAAAAAAAGSDAGRPARSVTGTTVAGAILAAPGIAASPLVSRGPLIAEPLVTGGVVTGVPVVIPGNEPILGYDPLDRIRAIRADDLFSGVFRFHNFRRNRLTNRAVREEPERPSFLTLDLAGQHLGEEVDLAGDGIALSLPLRARLAGASRIAVRMPQGTSGVEVTLEALLGALADWPLEVDPLARYRNGGLTKQMLESVGETFGILALELFLALVGKGLLSITAMAANRAAALVPGAYQTLVSNRSFGAASRAAEQVRAAVEIESGDVAAAARAQFSGTPAEEREVAETAEALTEVHFARALADRILGGEADFGILLLQMSGLFDLMMHPHRPAETATALELPYRLITSPGYWTRFAHAGAARASALGGGLRAELWHTRLMRRAGGAAPEIGPEGADFFALWTPDYDLETDLAEDLPMSLTADWRRQIVKRTTGHNEEGAGGARHEPVPAKVRRLELSALGATLDLAVDWPDQAASFPDFGALVGWQHRIALGRDQKVRIAETGWLYPMGIRCTKVTLTERRFRQADGQRVAALVQREFLLVDTEPLVFPAEGQAFAGRALPFRRLAAVTETTPTLDTSGVALPGPPGAVRVKVGGRPFAFEFAGIDAAGREVGFRLAQFFLPGNFTEAPASQMTALAAAWEASAFEARLGGQTLRVVPDAGDDLDMAVEGLAFSATAAAGDAGAAIRAGLSPFHPRMTRARATIPGVAELTGLAGDMPREIVFTGAYLDDALGGAARRVVLEIRDAVDLDFGAGLSSDAMGAIGLASQRLGAIAEGLGPVPLPDPARLGQLIEGNLDWRDLLPDFRVLGRFLLEKLLGTLIGRPVALPSFETRRTERELRREWMLREPITRSIDEAGITVAPRAGAEIFLHALVRATLHEVHASASAGGSAAELSAPTGLDDPGAEAHGHLTAIDVTVFGLVRLRFDEIGFDAVAGAKPESRVRMGADPMEFMGPLEFLNVLKDLIPPAGFGDGAQILPGPHGIEAGFDLGLPNTEIGVLALKNMTLVARTTLPFDRRPLALEFAFNERHRPFEVAVAGFGGGGFFALALDAGGIREIEAALEFGASASLDIGVASGSVSIKGGVYFRYASGDVILEGYVELRGRLSVLALISASLLFHMALAYEKQGGRAYVRGEATLRVEVEVLFFSTSVTLHVERRFEAGAADPRFAETTGAKDWIAYCSAYA